MSVVQIVVCGVALLILGLVAIEALLRMAKLIRRKVRRYDAGSNETESAAAAAQSIADDLMRHGEARGVEIILTDITVTGNGTSRVVSASAGIADSHARLQVTLEATVTFS